MIEATANGVELAVKVVPGASRDRIVGPLGDALKIQVSAAPEKGKANVAVIKLIAERLGISPRSISVIRGETNPRKVLAIHGMSLNEVQAALDSE